MRMLLSCSCPPTPSWSALSLKITKGRTSSQHGSVSLPLSQSRKMYTLAFLSTSILALFATAATSQQYVFSAVASSPPCLDAAEAYLISLRWLQIFQTDKKGKGIGGALVETTLSPNFTYYDEGASFGEPAPLYDGADQVYESVTGSGYSGALVTNVRYSINTAFASCDTAVVRWQSDSVSAKAKGV